MKYPAIILWILCILAGITVYFLSARVARKKSDEIVSKFREVDSSLQLITDSSNLQKGIESIQGTYMFSSLRSKMILLIDSLKEDYAMMPETIEPIHITKPMRATIGRLLNDIQEFNKMKWDMVDSAIPDTIQYGMDPNSFGLKEKFANNFDNVPKVVSITYLNYLRNQITAMR